MRIRKSVQVGGNYAYWTFNPPALDDIDADNDSVMTPSHQFEVDLSKIASEVLGRQSSMTSTCRIHQITVGIRPVDDVDDNDESTSFAGRIWWKPPTDHVKQGLQLMRKMERASEEDAYDSDSFFLSSDKDYSGLRYSYNFDGAIDHQTASSVTGWDHTLLDLRTAYNTMTAPDQSNALFDGRFGGDCNLMWNCSWATGVGAGDSPPKSDDDTHVMNHLALPILRGAVEYSSGDEVGAVDDDYYLWVDIDFTPELEVF